MVIDISSVLSTGCQAYAEHQPLSCNCSVIMSWNFVIMYKSKYIYMRIKLTKFLVQSFYKVIRAQSKAL